MHRRRALRALVPPTLLGLLILLPARPSSAALTGPCTATIAGTNVNGHDTAASAIPLRHDQIVQVGGSVLGGTASEVTYSVRLAGIEVGQRGGIHVELTGPTWTGSVAVRDYAWLAVGLFEVRGNATTTAGPCVGQAYVCVSGKSVFATVAGTGSVGIVLIGVVLALVALGRRRRALGAGLLGLTAGALSGVGGAVLLQGTCTLPLTGATAVAIPLAVGLIAGMAALLLNRFRARRVAAQLDRARFGGAYRAIALPDATAVLDATAAPDPSAGAATAAFLIQGEKATEEAPSDDTDDTAVAGAGAEVAQHQAGIDADAGNVSRTMEGQHTGAMQVAGQIQTGATPGAGGSAAGGIAATGVAATGGSAIAAAKARTKAAWSATHLIPREGLYAYASPSPAAPSTGMFPGGAAVHQEERRGDWALVSLETGSAGWVDARRLLRIP